MLAKGLADAGFEIVASGGTSKFLRAESVAVTDVAEITGAEEMLEGRVKTLHPTVRTGFSPSNQSSPYKTVFYLQINQSINQSMSSPYKTVFYLRINQSSNRRIGCGTRLIEQPVESKKKQFHS